jgi:hypothetical protein
MRQVMTTRAVPVSRACPVLPVRRVHRQQIVVRVKRKEKAKPLRSTDLLHQRQKKIWSTMKAII